MKVQPDMHYFQSTKFSYSPIMLVTKPTKVYKISDLVPPQSYLENREERRENFLDINPKTYQSLLVKKYNFVPTKYLQRTSVLEKIDNEENYISSDWKRHWIAEK